jgi:hypothetical protein
MVGTRTDATVTRRYAGFGQRTNRAILALAIVALALAAAGCGSANPTTKAGSALLAPQTLNLRDPPGNAPPGVGGDFTGVYNRSPPGTTQFPPGSSFIVWNTLEGPGLQVIFCVVARQHPSQTFWCTSTYSLPAGQIDAVGDYDNSAGGDAGTVAVVGGTGAYLGARGTVTTRNDNPHITIRLK